MNKLLIVGSLLTFGMLTFVASTPAAPAHKSKIEMIYQPQPNGDFRLSLYGSDRTLVCEEKAIQIVSQGDAVNPLVIECKHTVPASVRKHHEPGCWMHHGDGRPNTRMPDSECRVHN